VQYHPEAASGTHDADYLFDRFVELVETNGKRAVEPVGTHHERRATLAEEKSDA
jgi:hypothetical protein